MTRSAFATALIRFHSVRSTAPARFALLASSGLGSWPTTVTFSWYGGGPGLPMLR